MALTLPILNLGPGKMPIPGAVGIKLKGLSKNFEFAAMLQMQQPVPIAKLNSIVSKLTDVILKATGKQNDANARSKLQSALTAALNPPSAGPPTAAILQVRIQTLLTNLSTTNAGQKNDLSGQILDAAPAKELPAQLKKSGGIDRDTIARDAAALTRALLDDTSAPAPTLTKESPAPAAALQNSQNSAPAPADSDVISRIIARAIKASNGLAPQDASTGKPVVAIPGAVQRATTAAETQATVLQAAPPHSTQASKPAVATPLQIASPQAAAAPRDIFDQIVKSIESAAKAQDQTQSSAAPQLQTTSGQPQLQPQGQAQVQTQAPAGAVTAAQTTPVSLPAQIVTHNPIAPYTSIDPSAVIDQIIKGIVVNTSGQNSQIRLRLQPESLGEVTMRLTVSGNNVSANVVTQNADVRQMLLTGQSQLSKSLAQSGLTLGGFAVSVFSGDAGDRQQQTAQQNRLGFKLGGWQIANDTGDEPVTDLRFGPPLVSGARSLVLNHLV